MANSYIKKLHDNLYQYFNKDIHYKNALYSIVKNPDGWYQIGLGGDLPDLSNYVCASLELAQSLIDNQLKPYLGIEGGLEPIEKPKQTLWQKIKRFLGVEK
jgi:hypothetical protein